MEFVCVTQYYLSQLMKPINRHMYDEDLLEATPRCLPGRLGFEITEFDLGLSYPFSRNDLVPQDHGT